jgi:hypothetical protein
MARAPEGRPGKLSIAVLWGCAGSHPAQALRLTLEIFSGLRHSKK